MTCNKHTWVKLLNRDEPMPDEQTKTRYQLEFIIGKARTMNDITFCTSCGVAGHLIKSHRGGVRVNGGHEHYLNAARELADQYKFKLPEVNKP